MADEIDRANDAAEMFNECALRQKRDEGPPACGVCYNCDSHLTPGKRWCDSDCEADWRKREFHDSAN